ncbi:MAC/perforin domain-containing protein [Phormidium tenue]|nr:MAC/perforin domain-containing protein [Phormidium tenue]MBD2234980.1 hypothetical protein [Phormidium tenue FACHB-1052]
MGGVIYSIVVDGHVEMPRFVSNKGDTFQAGLFGDILLGIAGAFILEALLPSSLMNPNAEQPSSIPLAATGIIGGYGGRAILRFALNRFFKLSGELPKAVDFTTVVESDAEESQTASEPAFQLITQIDNYIRTRATEAEQSVLIQTLTELSGETRRQVFEALVDLRQQAPELALTTEQRQRMITVHEQLLAQEPEKHKSLGEMALLYRDLDPPDYSKALTCLDLVITLRGPLTIGKPWQYELNRAAIRILQASRTTRVPDFSPPVQENIIADLLAIAQIYNLETILQAARERQIPSPVEDWLRLNQAYLTTRNDTRTVSEAVSRVLGLQPTALAMEETQSTTIGSLDVGSTELPLPTPTITSQTVDAATETGESVTDGQKPFAESNLASTTVGEIGFETTFRDPVPNPEGETLEAIFYSLGKCYDILYLDPFDISGTGKDHRVFDFYPGEAEKAEDEGVQFLKPKGTQFTPISSGGHNTSEQTKVLYTEADIQREFGGSISGLVANLFGLFMPFSLSKNYQSLRQERRHEKSIYAFTKAEYLDFRLGLPPVGLKFPPDSWKSLHPNQDFEQAVSLLPVNDDLVAYNTFIQEFGTHIATQVDFGGLVYHKIRLNESTYASVVKRGGNFEAEAAKMFKASFSKDVEKSRFEEIRDHSEELKFCGGNWQGNRDAWFSTVKDDPTPVKLELLPLYKLLTPKFFPKDNQILQKQNLLKEATKQYLEQQSEQPEWELWPSVTAGGGGGEPFADIEVGPHTLETNQQRYQDANVSEIKVWVGACIDGVQLVLDGDALPSSTHGGEGGQLMTYKLNPGEYIRGVEVTTGTMKTVFVTSGPYITSIKFIIEGRSPWIVGHHNSSEAITLDIPENYQAVGFHGRCGKYMDSLGVISIPVKDLSHQLEA